MLDLTELKNDRPIIARLKKTLLSKFRPNSENDIQLALQLSHYLLSIDDVESSRRLLESYLYFDMSEKEEKHEHLWHWNSHGILLLAYLEQLSGNHSRSDKLINIVEKSDYFSCDESDRHQYYDELEDLHEEYDFHLSEYMSETHKLRCQVLSQICIGYLFFFVLQNLTLSSDTERMKDQLPIVCERIDKLNGLLKDELLHKR